MILYDMVWLLSDWRVLDMATWRTEWEEQNEDDDKKLENHHVDLLLQELIQQKKEKKEKDLAETLEFIGNLARTGWVNQIIRN